MIPTLAKSSMIVLLGASAPIETSDTSLWFQWGLAGVVVASKGSRPASMR